MDDDLGSDDELAELEMRERSRSASPSPSPSPPPPPIARRADDPHAAVDRFARFVQTVDFFRDVDLVGPGVSTFRGTRIVHAQAERDLAGLRAIGTLLRGQMNAGNVDDYANDITKLIIVAGPGTVFRSIYNQWIRRGGDADLYILMAQTAAVRAREIGRERLLDPVTPHLRLLYRSALGGNLGELIINDIGELGVLEGRRQRAERDGEDMF